jgi:CHAT domain-containing protein
VRSRVPLDRVRANLLVAAHLDEIGRRVAAPAMGAELFDALLKSGRQTLAGASTLVLIADAPYLRMAAAALYDRERGRFLIEDFTVLAASSATDYVRGLAAAAAMRATGSRRAAVLPAPLAGHTPSIAAVTTAYPSAEVHSPEQVTAHRIVEDLHDRDVLHIAAPMVGSREFPTLSHLVLADETRGPHGGTVSAAHLASLPDLRTQLVVLEDAGPERSAREPRPHMLARALLAAGVRHVVMPVASLGDPDAAATWREFHRQVAAGSSAVDSLRRAQLAALSASDRRAGPWAALTIFGAAQ